MTTAPPSAHRSESLWFLDTLVTVHVSHDSNADGISVIESLAPYGDSPPLHVHHTEDELFTVLEGELLVRVDGRDLIAPAGRVLLAPKGVPHTYRVTSTEGARFLITTMRGDFEAMVRAASRPAEAATLPPSAGAPTREQVEALGRLCATHDIDLLGPPLA